MSNVTPNRLHFSLSLSKRALNAPGGVRPTSRRRREQQQFCSFPSRRVAFRTREVLSSSRRRKRRTKPKLSGEKSASESSSGRSKRCLQNASERRSIARDWSKWSIVEVLVDACSFEGLCSVRLSRLCAL